MILLAGKGADNKNEPKVDAVSKEVSLRDLAISRRVSDDTNSVELPPSAIAKFVKSHLRQSCSKLSTVT
jgi:hypothetical protein